MMPARPPAKPKPSAFKIAYRILNWSTLVALIIMIAMVLHKTPPPDVTRDPVAAARVEQKFAAADQAKAQGQVAPQVQLDSTELNSYLAQNLELPSAPQANAAVQPATTQAAAPQTSSAPAVAVPGEDQPSLEEVQSSVKDVKVDMDGDLIKAYVIFNLHGQDLSLELDGHLASENGYLKFEPVAGKLGSMPLPQSALDAAVSRLMSSPENREKLRLPDDIGNIQIQNGQAVVSYK